MSGDENKLKKYRFPETLTNQSRWFGLPLDELDPRCNLYWLGNDDIKISVWYWCGGSGLFRD